MKKKRPNKNKEQLSQEMKQIANAQKGRKIVREVLYPVLLKYADTIRQAEMFADIFKVAITVNMQRPFKEKNIGDLDWSAELKEEQIVIEHIALDPIDEEIIEDSNEEDTVDMIEAKRLWKEANPDDSLKNQRRLLEAGLIAQLPWEAEPFLKKKSLTYLEKVGKNQIKREISED
jgi:hypothetical protein